MSTCVICGHEAVAGGRFCEVCGPAWEDLKTAKEVTATCRQCGATFTYTRFKSCKPHRLCPACKVLNKKESRRRFDEKRRQAAASETMKAEPDNGGGYKFKPMTFDEVKRQPKKPRGMSAVRWRIEQRRRKNPAYYAHCNNP